MGAVFGFVGIEDKHLLKKMSSTLTHRALDGFHYHICNKAAFGQGITKIGTDYCPKPIVNEEGTVVLLMNGRLFNSKELKDTLKQRHEFSTTFSGEVILHLYEEHGMGFVPALEGDFGFCLYDSKKKELILCADSAGTKPIYYYQNKGAVIFGSDIKAILEFGFEKQLDTESLKLFLKYLLFPTECTLIKDIRRLLPSSYIQFSGAKLDSIQYHQIKENILDKPESYFVKKARILLERAVENRIISDVPIHISLGGLDSGVLVGLAASNADRICTYTLTDTSKSEESNFSRQVSEKYGTRHHEVFFDPNQIIDYYNFCLPYFNTPSVADIVAMVQSFVLEKMKKEHTIVLNGSGPDKIFGGKKSHKLVLNRHFIGFPQWVKKGCYWSTYTYNKTANFINRFQNSFKLSTEINLSFDSNIITLSQLYAHLLGTLFEKYYTVTPVNQITFPIYDQYLKNSAFSFLNRINKYSIEKISYLEQIPRTQVISARSGFLDCIPFLDKQFVQFTFSIPTRYKYQKSTNKVLFFKATRNLVPKYIQKHGFVHPFKEPLYNRLLEFKGVINTLCNSSKIFSDMSHKYLSWVYTKPNNKFDQWNKLLGMHTMISLGIWYEHYFNGVKPGEIL